MMRTVNTVLGLAAGLAILAAPGPASAVHIFLSAQGESGTGVVIAPITTPPTLPLVDLGDPLTLFGSVTDDTPSIPPATFTHTFNFGFNDAGDAGASVTPNVLTINGGTVLAGFAELEGTLTGPTIAGTLNLEPVASPEMPRTVTIAAQFAAIVTAGLTNPTPYTLTITGQLFEGVTAGNYTGNIGVVPLPSAAALFLTALGGLALARRYRRRGEEGMAAAA